MDVLLLINEKRLMPVVVIDRAEDAPLLAEALLEAGLNIIEITLRTDAAIESIEVILNDFPEMIVGAGTVLDAGIIQRLVDIGVQFGVSPGLNDAVVDEARRLGLPFLPGVVTPTEVERALNLDLKLLKFFPAQQAGGPAYLKALAGPYANTGVRFIPLGGVNVENAGDYLALPVVAAVGGSWFVSRELINAGSFSEITRLTREALALTAPK